MTLAVAHRPCPAEVSLDWLAPGERQTYAGFGDASRRQAWLHGRVLAKQLILERALGWSPTPSAASRLEICSRDGLGRAIAPRVLLDGRVQAWSLSIAHCATSILVALSCDRRTRVGVDVVPTGAVDVRSLDPWLGSRERAWLTSVPAAERPAAAAVVWAIKEATYKAVGDGARFVPRRVEARAGANAWQALVDDRVIAGEVRVGATDTEVTVVVTAGGETSR